MKLLKSIRAMLRESEFFTIFLAVFLITLYVPALLVDSIRGDTTEVVMDALVIFAYAWVIMMAVNLRRANKHIEALEKTNQDLGLMKLEDMVRTMEQVPTDGAEMIKTYAPSTYLVILNQQLAEMEKLRTELEKDE